MEPDARTLRSRGLLACTIMYVIVYVACLGLGYLVPPPLSDPAAYLFLYMSAVLPLVFVGLVIAQPAGILIYGQSTFTVGAWLTTLATAVVCAVTTYMLVVSALGRV